MDKAKTNRISGPHLFGMDLTSKQLFTEHGWGIGGPNDISGLLWINLITARSNDVNFTISQ
ncbi:MAG TPA: hypothetical protein VIZ65_12190 [Cellvibrionaceae bacterium]